jgi:hypothetical protein
MDDEEIVAAVESPCHTPTKRREAQEIAEKHQL